MKYSHRNSNTPLVLHSHSLLFSDASERGIMFMQEVGKDSMLFQVAELEIPQGTTFPFYFLTQIEYS